VFGSNKKEQIFKFTIAFAFRSVGKSFDIQDIEFLKQLSSKCFVALFFLSSCGLWPGLFYFEVWNRNNIVFTLVVVYCINIGLL
jgi:hypothetical protein